VSYSYNAFVRGGHNILRYDNAHERLGHPDAHHKHVFDFDTGEELTGSPYPTGPDWPNLGDVIRELITWHGENYAKLTSPEEFAEPEAPTGR
jgi:hypothetical protein